MNTISILKLAENHELPYPRIQLKKQLLQGKQRRHLSQLTIQMDVNATEKLKQMHDV